MTCLHMNLQVHVACNFNCLFENEGTLQAHNQSYTLQMWYCFENGAIWSRSYYKLLIGSDIWPIE